MWKHNIQKDDKNIHAFGIPGNVDGYDWEDPESSALSAPSPELLSIKILWRSLHSFGLRKIHWKYCKNFMPLVTDPREWKLRNKEREKEQFFAMADWLTNRKWREFSFQGIYSTQFPLLQLTYFSLSQY